TSRPSTTPLTPSPGVPVNSSTGGSGPTSARAQSLIAAATTCSETASTAPANRSTVARSKPPAQTIPATLIRPSVTVPVLSSTTVSMSRVDSRAEYPLRKIPNLAATPAATINAVGVANPSAHGQAITRTASGAVNACCPVPPKASQQPNVPS